MIIGYKGRKREIKYKVITHNTMTFLEMQGIRETITIVPIYLNRRRWDMEFEQLKSVVNEVYGKNMIIIGDCNVRTGSLQDIGEEIAALNSNLKVNRSSMDTEIELRGRKYIGWLEDQGMCVLNGRVKGDEEGNLTFIGAMGNSVIDLAAVSYDLLPNINRLIV